MIKTVMRFLPMIFFGIFLLSPGVNGIAQTRFTISGIVKDESTGEALIGAIISIRELSGTGVTTNAYGFYSITLQPGSYTIISQYVGYEPASQQLNLSQNTRLNFSLKEKSHELEEVVVTGARKDENVSSTQMGVQKLDIKEIKNIPVLFGEKDVLKTMQLLPGVEPVGEGNSGFYVRGGGADQNLILLDEATVYNPSHLLGFFSVFNSDAIKDATLFKGGASAQYGGRLSSVVDIRMNDGNDKNFLVSGGLGLISSRLNVEGPIVKDRGSFSISGRRTYADLFLFLSKDTLAKNATLYFYDLNAKANYRINDNNQVFLSGYFGKDVLGLGTTYGLNWGNGTGTFRWNHLFNQRLFSNTSLIFSNYDYNVSIDLNNSLNIISRIRNYNIKQDYQYYAGPDNQINFGFNSIYYSVVPGAITANNNSFNLTNKYSWENALYFSHQVKLSDHFRTEYGLRLSGFSILGPGNFYTYDMEGNTLDSIHYPAGKFIRTYLNLEPRIALTFLLSGSSSIKASYDKNVQNLHLITNSTTNNPTSLWLPSSNNIKPETADLFSLGYYRNFNNNNIEFSTEVYYKNLFNQIDYKNGAQLNFNENVESQLLTGTGRAYGVEFYLKKNSGRLNGWLSYTLSRSEKKIDGINNNKYYPATQDRTHDVSVVTIFNASKKWTLSGTWVYYTGNAVTFPSGKYQVEGRVLEYYTERNGYRMPAYNRLDLAATWMRKKTDRRESSWTFSVYNLLNRSNAYTITFRNNPDDATKTQAVQTSLFKIIPSITYNFKF